MPARRPLFLLAVAAAALAGCTKERPDAAAAVPPPPAVARAALVPAWAARTNGVAVIRADFAKADSLRVTADVPLACDLSGATGLEFDFWCDNLGAFSAFTFYLKSGGGWYNCPFAPEAEGAWTHVTIRKTDAVAEGTPDGWHAISAFRLAGWRGGDEAASVAVANVRPLAAGRPDVAVIYADSLMHKGRAEAAAYAKFADTVTATLTSLGLCAANVPDRAVTADTLADVSAAVLPYNTSVPTNVIAALQAFTARGGRLLACYALPRPVAALLGVRLRGGARTDGGRIGGFRRAGAGMEGQPDFSPQASWAYQPAEPEGTDGEIVATWAAADRTSLGTPALIRTAAGIYMGHVWLGGTSGAPQDLMKAIVCDLAPGLKEKIGAHEAAARAKQDAARAFLAAQTPKAGEFRAFWCHNARGLGGGRSWDDAVKMLKDNGFTALFPNLAWGGAAFYQSDVLPVAADVAAKGDALDACLAACRKHGVECHVWKVCWRLGVAAPSAFVKRMADEGRLQKTFAGRADDRWLCPSHPANRRLEIEAMVELAKKRPDGIHFDYIRYPGEDHCFCDGCRARFEAVCGFAVTNWPSDVRADAALMEKWRAFRRDNITAVVRETARRVRAEAPGVKLSAALFREVRTDRITVAQDWAAWCREGLLDFICPMDYTSSPALFRSMVKRQKASAGNVPLRPGIGLSCWTDDGGDAARAARQILAVRDLGLDGFSVFNFDRRAENALPLLRLGITAPADGAN